MKNSILQFSIRAIFFLICLELFFYTGSLTSRFYDNLKIQNKLTSSHEVRILCLGDSMTQAGGDDSYPNQLEKILNQSQRDKNFIVINKSLAGKSSDYIIQNVNEWLDDYQPDYVIVMMGWFDSGYENALPKNFVEYKLEYLKSYRVVKALWNRKYRSSSEPPLNKIQLETPLEKKQLPITSKNNLKEMPEQYKKIYMLAALMRSKQEYKKEENLYRLLLTAPNQGELLKSEIYEKLGMEFMGAKKLHFLCRKHAACSFFLLEWKMG